MPPCKKRLQGLSEASRIETIVGSSDALLGFLVLSLARFLDLSLSLFGYNPKAFSAAAMLPKRLVRVELRSQATRPLSSGVFSEECCEALLWGRFSVECASLCFGFL